MPSLQKKCNEAQKNNPRGVDKFFFLKIKRRSVAVDFDKSVSQFIARRHII